MLPFTRDQFLANLVSYNEGIWPVQVAAFALGLLAMALLFWRPRMADRLIAGILAIMWLWTGVAYHWFHFTPINRAALIFGVLFVAQGAILAYVGLVRNQLRFGLSFGPAAIVGIGFVAYAAVLYPLLGIWTRSRISGNAGVRCHPLSGDDFHFRILPSCEAARVAMGARDPIHLVVDRRECSVPPRRAARLVTSGQRCCCGPVGGRLSQQPQCEDLKS